MNFTNIYSVSVNLEILSVAIPTLLIFFLGFIVYFQNTQKFSYKIFLLLAIITGSWGFSNYLYNQPNLGNLALIFLRIHMFLSVWYAFIIYLFFEILKQGIDQETFIFNKNNKIILFLSVIISVLNLTPFVFEKITKFSEKNTILEVKTNIGIIIFGFFVIYLLIKTIMTFLKTENKNWLLFIGFILSFVLHIIFNFIFPNALKNVKYVGLGSLFTFPFILFSAYTIFKQRFLNVRVIVTDIFILVLLFLTTIQIFNSRSLLDVVTKFIIFILIIFLGARLMKITRIEIEQKEKLDKLNRIKSEFLSFASHQVKAPMAIAKGYAELIAKNIYGKIYYKI